MSKQTQAIRKAIDKAQNDLWAYESALDAVRQCGERIAGLVGHWPPLMTSKVLKGQCGGLVRLVVRHATLTHKRAAANARYEKLLAKYRSIKGDYND